LKAALLRFVGKPLETGEVEVPELKPDEVLVKVKACGICRTDLHLMEGVLKPGKLPLILGHEAAGVVEETGSNVEEWKKGDRVIPYRYFTCGKCPSCLAGNEEVCYAYRGQLGFNWDGGFAEYFKAPEKNLVKLPGELSFQDGGTLACAGQTAYHAVKRRAEVKIGQTVLIMGAGGLGLQVLQYAKLAGATVLIADRSERKIEYAAKFNPDHLLNLNSTRFPEEVKLLTNDVGVDVAIDTTASSAVILKGLKSLRKLGKMLLLGASDEPLKGISSTQMLINEYEILGSRSSTKQELMEATAIAASKKIKSIITETYQLGQINEAMEKLKRGEIIGRATLTF
jgi:propanol-preferring alcohol dehydrogenase